jgi:hypothetical protein
MPVTSRLAALPLAIAVALGLSALAATARAADEPFGRLTIDQVAEKLGKPGVHVYDNNSKEDYAAGHVPGAKWVEYDHVQASDLPKDKTATLIFYCANPH